MPFPVPKDCNALEGLPRQVRANQRIWIDKQAKRMFAWDHTHGEIEVYNLQGKHIGVIDCDFNILKPAVHGRYVNV
jgi:hypothetical protein